MKNEIYKEDKYWQGEIVNIGRSHAFPVGLLGVRKGSRKPIFFPKPNMANFRILTSIQILR